jgi:SAM-dependent methyltransferase
MATSQPPRRADLTFSDRSGGAWAKLQDRTDASLDPFGLAAMAQLPLGPGDRVLDVGCGCGQTLLELAEVVEARGRVLGVDVSEPMLARARERTDGRPEIELVLADAQRYAFAPAAFDALFSRFGVMFFQDARAAFANLRSALRPGARLAFVCWQELARNPWATLPLEAVMRLLPPEAMPEMLLPDRPGPFSLSDPERLRGLLSGTGFDSVEVAPLDRPMQIGGAMTLAEAIDYSRQLGPAARAMADAPDTLRSALDAALESALAPFATERGVWMDAAALVVTARAA